AYEQGARCGRTHVLGGPQTAMTVQALATGVPGALPDAARSRDASEVLVALLRASLGTGAMPDAAPLAAGDWAGLAHLARHHGLVPVLHRALEGNATGVPSEWRRRFKREYLASAVQTLLVQGCVDEIGAAFERKGIVVIVMKGAALLRTLYDDPG